MALTATQKAQVRMYLGYSDGGGASPSNLDGAMAALSAEAETLVGGLLTSLAAVDAALTSSTAISRAGIIEVDNGGVKWERGNAAQSTLYQDGRRLVARLAAILGVPVQGDMFGSSIPASGPCGRG